MKKVLLLGIVTLIFCTCNNTSLVDKNIVKKEVAIFLNNWHAAAAAANFENYFKALDSSAVFIGTAAEEIWSKNQFEGFSKPYFDNGKAWTFTTLQRTMHTNNTGDFVWFHELLNTWMGTCRGSGVLEKKNNSWVLKQYVLSVAIPNKDIQLVIDAKKTNDSIFLERFKK